LKEKDILITEDDPDHVDLILDIFETENIESEIVLMKDKISKILIVDDDETFLLVTTDLLRREGYECYYAPDAMTVIKTLKSVKFDLLISGINMLGNTGLELIKRLREVAAGMPVILITGSPYSDTQIESLKPPVTACLSKPLDFEELLMQVRSSI
jgi:DNA-binding response OmpR family regulator